MVDDMVTIVDMASPSKDVSYVTLKETPCVVHRSPSLVASTTTKIKLTSYVLIVST